MGVRGLLHAAPCVAGHWLPKYYTAISELRKKVKMGKNGNVAGVVFLNSSGNKKANLVLGKALQEHALRLLG